MTELEAKFCIGQLIRHKLYDYRGVIVDIDPIFRESEDWYNNMALTKPPKDKPWYTVLVHDAVHKAYAAEQNLELDLTGERINHPELRDYFVTFQDGVYVLRGFRT